MAKHVVATVDEIPPGQRKIVSIDGRTIGVFNVGGEFYALRNSCPHQGGPLCTGRLTGFLEARVPGEYSYTRRGEILRCPWHGWEFDIKTGQSWYDPARVRVRAYPVSVESVPVEETTSGPQPELGSRESGVGSRGEAQSGPQPGPYMAETYEVTVERKCVVIEVP